MFTRSFLRSLPAAAVLVLAAACADGTPIEPPTSASTPEFLTGPSASIELLIQIASPTYDEGNPPTFSLSTLPSSVMANQSWSRTITIEPNHPFAPSVAVDYGDGTKKSLSVNIGMGQQSGTFTLSHKYTTPGTYTVRVVASTGDEGGVRARSHTITVTEDLNLYLRNVQISSPVTSGQPATISFEAEGPGGPEDLYAWEVAYGTGSKGSGFIPPGGSRSISYTWNAAGTYTVTITITNGERTATATRQVTVQQTPLAIENLVIPDTVRAGEPFTYSFRASRSGGGPNYVARVRVGRHGTWVGDTLFSVAPGGQVNGSMDLPAGVFGVEVKLGAEGYETVADTVEPVTVLRVAPELADIQLPDEVRAGETYTVRFVARDPLDLVDPSGYKAWAAIWGDIDAGAYAQSYFTEAEVQVELEVSFPIAGDHPLTLATLSSQYGIDMIDSLTTMIHVLEPEVICEPGSYKAGEACEPAPAGSYVPDAGAEEATLCAPGTYQDQTGQTSCIPAPAGRYVAFEGATAAEACEPGTFSAGTGATSCTPAPAGSYVSGSGATAAEACQPGTFSASAGSESCTPAPAGRYVSDPGATAAEACAPGTFSAGTGATSCTPAPAGSYVSGSGATAAEACEPGTFSAGTGATSCTPAPAGSYVSGSGATAAEACAPGTFSASAGSESCTPAPAGSYVSGSGATAAEACAPGTFSASAGSESCTPAPAGSYVSGSGATAAEACAPGTYQPEAGQTSCIAAPLDTYVDVSGATQVSACPAATATLGEGSTSAADCLPLGTLTVTKIDQAVSAGTLVPADGGKGGANQFQGWVRDVTRSVGFLAGPQRQAGCSGVRNALAKADGRPNPKDVVSGAAREAVAADLQRLIEEYGCSW